MQSPHGSNAAPSMDAQSANATPTVIQTVPQPGQPVNSQPKYSLPEIKTESGEDAIAQVPGAVVKYSLSSWTADEQERVTQALDNTGEFTPEQVRKWVGDVNGKLEIPNHIITTAPHLPAVKRCFILRINLMLLQWH